MSRLNHITEEREKLEVEAAKLRQFIMATINMLPDEDRDAFLKAFQSINDSTRASEASLKDACFKILQDARPNWLTAAIVRDRLVGTGFDFSSYMSNPLASVSTTLRRFKPEQVEETSLEGATAWRAKDTWISRAHRVDSKWIVQGSKWTNKGSKWK
jgi:hypothetical protein